MDESRILIVRHGWGRGRFRRYLRKPLEHVRRQRNQIYRRLIFHRTGDPPPLLDHVKAVVFWLADPLREWYPACYEEAVGIADEARRRGIGLINPPEALSNSIKSVQARLWQGAGIATPPVERYESNEELLAASSTFSYPLLVRGDEHHSQGGLRVFANRDQLLGVCREDLKFPCAVSPLVDVRAGFREIGSPACERLFHKKRLIVAGNIIRTKHMFFSSDPIVSSNTATFGQHRRRFWSPFTSNLSPEERECIDLDLAYWRQGEEHREVMVRACRALGIQFAAIDYSSLSDGSVMLWEANPHFHLPRMHEMMLPRQRLARERIASYHDAIADFLSELINHQVLDAEFEAPRQQSAESTRATWSL
jgi:hypothetical protein